MKKFIACALLVLMCCAPLCACSPDFSAEIDEAMDGLYDTLYNALELFFKKTGVEDDSGKDEGVTDGETGSGESGDNQGSQGTVDDDKNPTAPSDNQTAPNGGSNTANDDNQSINTDDSITDNGSGLEDSQISEDTKNEK